LQKQWYARCPWWAAWLLTAWTACDVIVGTRWSAAGCSFGRNSARWVTTDTRQWAWWLSLIRMCFCGRGMRV
jgi:hypothetical protein